VRIRPAAATDVLAVAALERAIFGLDAWTPSGVTDELDPRHRRSLVAETDEAFVGYAVAAVAGDTADLHRVAVTPAARRHGVARALLTELRETCRADGATRMLLEVSALNDAALAFYAAEGWVELDRRRGYYRDGSDAHVLALDLTPETV
jgi:ribosomal-protein-alanine N-acetyltransferase